MAANRDRPTLRLLGGGAVAGMASSARVVSGLDVCNLPGMGEQPTGEYPNGRPPPEFALPSPLPRRAVERPQSVQA
jgi:hypothetical protein